MARPKTGRRPRRKRLALGLVVLGLSVSVALVATPGHRVDVFPLRTPQVLKPVAGRVLCAGRPAEGATVYLHPRDGAAPARWPNGYPRARVRPNGTFVIATDQPGDGAPEGRFGVLVRWPRGSALAERDEDRRADRFGGRFLAPDRPRWVIDVGPEGLADVRIDLPD